METATWLDEIVSSNFITVYEEVVPTDKGTLAQL